MKLSCWIFAIGILLSTGVTAIQLQPTPVQEALNESVALLGSNDEFDQPSRTDWGATITEETSDEGRKSIWKAGLLSAVVPGAGEYYLGNRRKARYFFAAEAITWAGYLSFRIYGNWKKDDYIRYAAVHANVGLTSRDEEFHDAVGFFNNRDEYNTIGRIFEPERDYLPDLPENHWQWESEQDRSTYRALKNSSRESYRRSDFMIGVAIIGRIISVVDAVRDARNMRRRLGKSFACEDNQALRLSVSPLRKTNQIKLTLATGF